MTTAVMNYINAPLSGIWKSVHRTFITIGYARAAAELHRQGYHEEAKHLMTEKLELSIKENE